MTAPPLHRPGPREAGPELLVAAKWEEFVPWLLGHTGRWPKSVRFTLAQRIENHALDVTEALVIARYEPAERRVVLRRVNLVLERLRHLFRIARDTKVSSSAGFESAMRGIDECGRMIHGWRSTLEGRGAHSRAENGAVG